MKKTLKQILNISLITLSCNPVSIDKGKPEAYFTCPPEACVNTPVQFDASKSNDPDGKILEYHWDFGDGGFGKEEKPVHIYKELKVFLVELTVTDNDLKEDTYIGYIEIINCEES